MQLLVAGKAHPRDTLGKDFVQRWVEFARQADMQTRVVFLEDYDITLAQHLVQGVDVWINTPRQSWEASGTSGMKVLVNGGLNLSELDGWWAEAHTPEVGWALADGDNGGGEQHDAAEAQQLYSLLEDEVVTCFYERDAQGLPRRWLAHIRASMAQLTPRFSTNRMLFEYVRDAYLPAAAAYRRRTEDGGRVALDLARWDHTLRHHWREVHLAQLQAESRADGWRFSVQVYLGDLDPAAVRVELCCEPEAGDPAAVYPMQMQHPLPGALNGYLYGCDFATRRPAQHYTPRVVPFHPHAEVPLEAASIAWYGG